MDHSKCGISMTICERFSLGQGNLDEFGYWEIPCEECAKEFREELKEKFPNENFLVWSPTEADEIWRKNNGNI